MRERRIRSEADLRFCQDLVREYFRFGSIREVLLRKPEIAISEGYYYLILESWGIVASPGRYTILTEAIHFFNELIRTHMPTEQLYLRMPGKFRTSLSTLRHIYTRIKKEVYPRKATALIVTPHDNPNLVLIGKDKSIERLDLGKPRGALTIPATFSERNEQFHSKILRVLQQEVLEERVIARDPLPEIAEERIKLLMRIGVADVDVSVYLFPLDIQRFGVSSSKLDDLRFQDSQEILRQARNSDLYRAGTQEVARAYINFINGEATNPSNIIRSNFNIQLASEAF